MCLQVIGYNLVAYKIFEIHLDEYIWSKLKWYFYLKVPFKFHYNYIDHLVDIIIMSSAWASNVKY